MSRYEVHARIGSGGAATVHLARWNGDGGFRRVVAVKRLKPHVARDEDARVALLTEAGLASRVSHPNVVAVLDVIARPDDVFLVMDYVHGETLNRLLGASKREGAKPPTTIAVAIVASILRGLHAAHETRSAGGTPLELVHRDVSPQNVVVGVDGVVQLVDFGIAKATGRAYRTRTGEVKGKLGYMPPEQLGGEPIDRRADVFAAGVILWETLTGKRLFRAASDEEVIALVLAGQRAAPSTENPSIPAALDAIVLRALACDPRQRFATALEMATALEVLPMAPASEIGAWVEHLASEALQERARLIDRMDHESPELELSTERSSSAIASTESVVARGGRASVVASRGRALVSLIVLASATAVLLVRRPPAASTGTAEALASAPATAIASSAAGPEPASAAGPERASASKDEEPDGAAPLAEAPRAHGARRPWRTPPPTGSSACSPPFTIDATGRKHFKQECFPVP